MADANASQNDFLLKTFFEKERWEAAIEKAYDKKIKEQRLREMCSPDARIELYHKIKDGSYKIAPPHEAQIPKDDGSMRTVYINEDQDRVILSIINDMLFDYCRELIHPRCKSYQKGLGCGKIVKEASQVLHRTPGTTVGVKIDLSKYFDSVPIRYIDEVFDKVEAKTGKSKIIDLLRTYYHDDTVLDMEKKAIQKYTSLRQGCAVAAFLADAVLYDIDETVSGYDVFYVRYSDDILITGKQWRKAYEKLSEMLETKDLKLNPNKVEQLSPDRWFKFLGFTIKDNLISISKKRVKTFQKEIEQRTFRSKSKNLKQILHQVYGFLYKGQQDYSWATGILPIINVPRDINTLNQFVMDAVRAAVTRKARIGGLGVVTDGDNYTITRGKGRNVRANRDKLPQLEDYMTIKCMQNAMLTSKEAYKVLVQNL